MFPLFGPIYLIFYVCGCHEMRSGSQNQVNFSHFRNLLNERIVQMKNYVLVTCVKLTCAVRSFDRGATFQGGLVNFEPPVVGTGTLFMVSKSPCYLHIFNAQMCFILFKVLLKWDCGHRWVFPFEYLSVRGEVRHRSLPDSKANVYLTCVSTFSQLYNLIIVYFYISYRYVYL